MESDQYTEHGVGFRAWIAWHKLASHRSVVRSAFCPQFEPSWKRPDSDRGVRKLPARYTPQEAGLTHESGR